MNEYPVVRVTIGNLIGICLYNRWLSSVCERDTYKYTAMAKLIEPQLFKHKFNLYEQLLRYISSDKKENMELYNSCKKKVGKEYKFLLLDIQNICSKVHKKLIHQLTPRRDIM